MQFIELSILFGLGALVFYFLGRQQRRRLSKEYAIERPNGGDPPARRLATIVTLVLLGPVVACVYEAVTTGAWQWSAALGALILVIVVVQILSRIVARREPT